MKTKFGFLFALAAAALVVGAAAPAKAILMNVSTSNASTTTLTGGASGDRALAQSLTITDSAASTPDVIGVSVDVATRYTSNVAADRAIATSGSTATARIDTNYTVSFSVIPQYSGSTYQIVVDSKILGELTLLDDVAGTQSNAEISNVTGKLNGVTTAGLGLTGIAENFSTGTGTNDAQEKNKSASNSINLGTFSGPQSFTLNFTFFTRAAAPQSLLGADEAAVRLGSSGPLSGATADDYPGPADVVDRIQNNDGHFITVTTTILSVPEPSTMVMAGIGAIGLCLAAWRRRRA